mmetsp:Transcript_34198/g.59824  ORF Transcript_34198/g.59824 Transcript_34198/m.59824 type:complete len:144 (-) Transcript_34198:381-812(-)
MQQPSMLVARADFGTAFYRGCIYAIGGKTNGASYARDCERLVLDESLWEAIPTFPQSAKHVSVIVIEKAHYSFGGFSGFKLKRLDSIHRLDFDSLAWDTLPLKLSRPEIRIASFKIEAKAYLFIKQTLYNFDPQAPPCNLYLS